MMLPLLLWRCWVIEQETNQRVATPASRAGRGGGMIDRKKQARKEGRKAERGEIISQSHWCFLFFFSSQLGIGIADFNQQWELRQKKQQNNNKKQQQMNRLRPPVLPGGGDDATLRFDESGQSHYHSSLIPRGARRLPGRRALAPRHLHPGAPCQPIRAAQLSLTQEQQLLLLLLRRWGK